MTTVSFQNNLIHDGDVCELNILSINTSYIFVDMGAQDTVLFWRASLLAIYYRDNHMVWSDVLRLWKKIISRSFSYGWIKSSTIFLIYFDIDINAVPWGHHRSHIPTGYECC